MNDDLHRATANGNVPGSLPASPHRLTGTKIPTGWLRTARWLPASMAALLWLMLVYGLPLHALRESRQTAKGELARLLQNGKPDTPAILDAFDRATEEVLFSAARPYFILGVSTLFLVAHLASTKRRLSEAERNIQTLRDVVLGVDGVPLR